MNNNKSVIELKNLKKRLAAFALAATVTITAGGCSLNKEEEPEYIGFSTSTTYKDNGNTLYTHIINTKGLVNLNNNSNDSFNNISFATILDEKTYDDGKYTAGFFINNIFHVIPEDFYGITKAGYGSRSNFDHLITVQKLLTTKGEVFTVIKTTVTAKRDMDSCAFKKGDQINATSIYNNGQLVAFKQTGTGSYCQNVIDAQLGDVDVALSTVSEQNILTETKEVSNDELFQYEEKLNTAATTKVLTKR